MEPTDSTVLWYFQLGGNPTDDTGALGGTPDFTAPITPATNNFINAPTILGSLNQYRGVGTFRQEATGSLHNCRITNRCGGKIPSTSGTFTVVSSSPADTGVLWVAFLASGVWHTEELTLSGRTPVAGATSWDSDEWIAVYEPLAAPVGNLLLQVAGQTVGVIFGTSENAPGSPDISTWMCCTLYDVALATALDTPISSDDRRTDPVSGIGSWSKATRWQGADASLSVPGGTMTTNKWISLIARLKLPGGVPKPYGGKLRFFPDLIGDPVP